MKPEVVKTTPQNVELANKGLFSARLNVPQAAKLCGMTEREMRMTFREFLKHNPPTYGVEVQLILPL
ncbi:rob transcription factor [Synechococcus phage S-CREM2]|nr:rob transcription factor [Synechococcus phage S-CREM2]